MQLVIMHITIYSIIIPIGVGLWRHSSLEKEAKWLLYMLIPVAINQFVSVWWLYYVEKNNIPFYHLYILMELLFISRIYYSYLKGRAFHWIVPAIAVAFSILFAVKLIGDVNYLWTYSTHLRAIEAVIILFFAGSYFVQVYRKQEIIHLHKSSGFWIGGGLILYFTCNLLLFTFSELVYAQESQVFQSIWAVHAILTLLLYLSFTIALLCKKKEKTF